MKNNKAKEDWTECSFEDLLNYVQPTKYIVESTKYSDDYKTPVLTAGKSFIKGYTNETEGVFDDLPTIIFDDFTTATQFVNFKFKVKSSAMKILVPTSKLVNMTFAYHYMQVHQVRSDTHKRYWISVYAKMKILLPSLAEQRAIVAKIEELFSSLDNGIADLKKAQAQLKIYRQAVLKKAFEGGLTKEWRAKQTDLSNAEELLEQIKEERQNHYKEQVADWTKAVKDWEKKGKEFSRPSKPKKISDFITDYEEKTLIIPTTWLEGVLECIADAVDPQPSHRTPPKVNGGVPFVSIADIDKITGEINFEDARPVGNNVLVEHINRYKLRKGDFVIGKIGTIGKPFFIPTERFFTLSANVVLVKPFERTCSPKFLFYYNISPQIEQQFTKGAKATTQAAFGIQKVRLLRVPLCAIEEQHQVVQEIESRLSVCDKVEESILESLEKSKALRQSILKKAFEGNLLNDQELTACKSAPDYEPAAVLLERIKAEKNNKK